MPTLFVLGWGAIWRLALLVTLCGFLASCDRDGGGHPRHLLLISVDTLRADHLGSYGHSLELTPNLDRLAKQSELFSGAYAPAPFTLPSIVALLTGHYPTKLGVMTNGGRLPAETPTLATLLQARGYRTGAVISSYILRERAGLDVGFDVYNDTLPGNELNRAIPERIAEYTTDAAVAMLDRLHPDDSTSFFLWIHYQDPHGPYTPSWERRARYLATERDAPDGQRRLPPSPTDKGMGGIPKYQIEEGIFEAAFYRAGYNAEINYMDEQVGRLLENLEAKDLLQETVIVFTADHGEGLGEDDYWFAHGEYLNEELLRVPLLIAVPGRSARQRDDLVTLLDVLPTVAALFGVPTMDGLAGRDLFKTGAEEGESTAYFFTGGGESTIWRFGLAKGGFRYVLSIEPQGPKEELFRLGYDRRDRLVESPEVAQSMRTELSSFRLQMFPEKVPPKKKLTPIEREKLKALGYSSD